MGESNPKIREHYLAEKNKQNEKAKRMRVSSKGYILKEMPLPTPSPL